MIPALEYFFKRLYEAAPNDLDAYNAHVAAVEQAFDLHQEHLLECVMRAQELQCLEGPFSWKHCDTLHGLLLEDVDAGQPLVTHKPVLVIQNTLSDPDMCYYAQAFYITMVMWSPEKLRSFTQLYHTGMLKHAETMQLYATVASLSITWADLLLEQPVREPADWELRFQAFGVLATKCVPCPHVCGRVMVMGPEYFEQVDELLCPNTAMTPHTWSMPLGVFEFKSADCTAHTLNQVSFAVQPIKAGEFMRVTLKNPLIDPHYPAHMKNPEGAMICQVMLSMGTSAMQPGEIELRVTRLTDVVLEHMDAIVQQDSEPPPYAWLSRLSSAGLAAATTMACVLQQADPAFPGTKIAADVMATLIPNLQLPNMGWYVNMWRDMQHAQYRSSVFDSMRAALREELALRFPRVLEVDAKLKLCSYNQPQSFVEVDV